jgi:cellulose biosynthesis protein BcsQ
MTKYITAFMGKGGGSKTTVLYSLAKYIHDQGKKVVVLDYDKNTSFTLQYERRRLSLEDGVIEKMNFPEVRTMRAPKSAVTAQQQIMEIGKDYDYVIIDLAGDIVLLHEAVARMCHIALVPTMPEDKYVGIAIDCMDLLLEIQEDNDGLPIAAIARMSFKKGGVVERMQNKVLEEYPLLDAITTPYPAQYAYADKFGLSITEMDLFGSKSTREKQENVAHQMRMLSKEIFTTAEAL